MATRAVLRRRPKILTPTVEQSRTFISTAPIADILTQVAYIFFALLEGLLILRFVFRLAGADPFNSFTAWLYNSTSVFTVPFDAMFPSPVTDGSVLEVGTLVAMIAYLFIFYLAVAVFRLFVPTEEIIDEGEI
jgi:hypothetical protein